MAFQSPEGSISVPSTDVVSFSFDWQLPYDDDAPLLLDADEPSRFLTTRSYRALVCRLIAGFKASGLQDGDCVLCHIGNAYYYPALFLSILGAGGIWCGSNPANRQYEIDHLVKLGNPRFIITNPETLITVQEVCDQRGITHENIFVLDTAALSHSIKHLSSPTRSFDTTNLENSTRPFTHLLCHDEQPWKTITTEAQARSTPAVYFPTSGTTGLPKLAMVSHHNLVAHHQVLHQEVPYSMSRLMSLPLFHLFAASYTFIQPPRYGHTTYIMRRFHLERYIQYLSRYRRTETYMAPPMVFAMFQSTLDVKHLIRTLRFTGCGGAPIDASSINKMRSLMHPDATMSSIWGMTELGVATSFRYDENYETGSVGRLMRGMEGKLIDSEGNLVSKDGEPGELHIRTCGVILGYRNMHSEEGKKEWFRTGDVCCLKGGKVYVVGRAKELIKVKGWQVAPAELEAVLLQHPEAADAAVVGTISSDGINEVPRAYVIRQKKLCERNMVTVGELYIFTRDRLASYKALDGGVCFVEAISRTASGKIQRTRLARMDRYRGSVTSALLAAGATVETRDKIAGIRDSAMCEVETAPPRPDEAKTQQQQSSTQPTALASTCALSRSSTSSGSDECQTQSPSPTAGTGELKPRSDSVGISSSSSSLVSSGGGGSPTRRRNPRRRSPRAGVQKASSIETATSRRTMRANLARNSRTAHQR